MPKYILKYKTIDCEKYIEESFECATFDSAFSEVQERAIKYAESIYPNLSDTKKIIYNTNDKFTASIKYRTEVQYLVQYLVDTIKEPENIIYLWSNKNYLFSETFKEISLKDAIKILDQERELGLDTETSGLDEHTDILYSIQLGVKNYQIVFDIQNNNGIIPDELKDFFIHYKGLFILQNAKFDLRWFMKQGILLKNIHDTMLAETILTHGLQFGGRDLYTIALKYCNIKLQKSVRKTIIDKGLTSEGILYGANDVRYLIDIKNKQYEKIKKLNLKNTLNLDNSFVIVLAYSEHYGIKLDSSLWSQFYYDNLQISNDSKKLLEDFLKSDGKDKFFSGMRDLFTQEEECIINWDSPKQVIKVFEEYNIDCSYYEKGEKKYSVNKNNIIKFKDNKFVSLYLDYADTKNVIKTFGLSWIDDINRITGRIHTNYTQLLNTGRLSSKSPNILNVPKGDLRKAFIPENGNIMIDADFSGQEQIVLVNFSQEKNLINFYKKGFGDMHSYNAFLMFPELQECPLADITPAVLKNIKDKYPDKRFSAKTAGFAINYGGDGSTIAANNNISIEQGNYIYEQYFKAFPGLKLYFEKVFETTSKDKYILFNNITNRKFFFNDNNMYIKYIDILDSETFWYEISGDKNIYKKIKSDEAETLKKSMNYPIQGSSADITKYAGILFFKEVLKRNWYGKVLILAFVHDEILVECPKDIVEEVEKTLIKCMEDAGKPFCKTVPLKADSLTGDYWVH